MPRSIIGLLCDFSCPKSLYRNFLQQVFNHLFIVYYYLLMVFFYGEGFLLKYMWKSDGILKTNRKKRNYIIKQNCLCKYQVNYRLIIHIIV